MDNSGLSHYRTSSVQPNAASCTTCNRNQRKFRLSTSKQFDEFMAVHQVQECFLSLVSCFSSQAARPPCPQGSLQLPLPLWLGIALAGDRPRRGHRRGHRQCAVQVEEAHCSDEIWGSGVAPLAPLQPNSGNTCS